MGEGDRARMGELRLRRRGTPSPLVGSKGGSVRSQLFSGFGAKRWRELLVGGFSFLCEVGDSCELRAGG